MQTVMETPIFTRKADALLSAGERTDLITLLAWNPLAGDVIPGTGGVRKLRFAGGGRRAGQARRLPGDLLRSDRRAAHRGDHALRQEREERSHVGRAGRRPADRGRHEGTVAAASGRRMTEEDKAMTGEAEERSEFLEAMQQAADILTGKLVPARTHRVPPRDVDVKAIRGKLGLSQGAFAARFGFSVGAVREWEQGRRRPEQAARTLLLVIEHDPQAVIAVLDRAAAA